LLLLVENDRAGSATWTFCCSQQNQLRFEVVGDSIQVEPYACFMPGTTDSKLVDGMARLMKTSNSIACTPNGFMSPIPPKDEFEPADVGRAEGTT
jgi:glutamate/aspartate transport system substrate-binding protein